MINEHKYELSMSLGEVDFRPSCSCGWYGPKTAATKTPIEKKQLWDKHAQKVGVSS